MATITKRKSGWSVQIRRKGYQPEYRTLPTKAAAEKWARERESEIDRGADGGRTPMRIIWSTDGSFM